MRRLALVGGVVAPVLWIALIGVAGAMRPEFSHVRDYISELGEHGSRTEWLMRLGGFGFTGLLYVVFAAALPAFARGRRLALCGAVLLALDGFGRIGAGVYACEPGCAGETQGQQLHHLFALLGFGSGVLAALAWGVACRGAGWPRALAPFSILCGLLAAGLLIAMQERGEALGATGLLEHLASAVLSLWVAVFASAVLARNRALPQS